MAHDPRATVAAAAGRVGDVVAFPVRHGANAIGNGARAAYHWSDNQVDDWGRDPDFVGRVWALSRLRWSITVGGHHHLPKRAGALIVVNARRFALAPVYTALAVGGAVGRPVRFVGRPDTAPAGPFLQRLGGLISRPDELANALRSGELVVMGTDHTMHPRRSGHVDHHLIGAAVTSKVKVFPAVTASTPLRRAARVEIGREIAPNRRRRGPLGELELADALERSIQESLDELGGTVTGTPLDWLPMSGMGGM